MNIYEHMSDVLDIMWGNLMEADKYIKMAHKLREECRAYADWCKEMAGKHIEFNANGRNAYERLRERLHEDHEHKDHHAGVLLVLDRNMAKLNGYCAEIKAKLAEYK